MQSSRDDSVETRSKKETVAWEPCTPLPTLETFSKKISSSNRYSIEIAGLLKKIKMTRFVECGRTLALGVGGMYNTFGRITRYGHVSNSW